MLAQRMNSFSTSGTAKARAAAKTACEAGIDVIDLTAGEILADPPATVRDGAIAAIEDGINRYTDTIGIEPLRAAIAEKVSRETGQLRATDEIAVTAGAKQALFNVALALLNPKDEVLIPAPYWTTFPAQLAIVGAKPVFVDTRTNNYLPRLQDLRAAITPATRAIVVNTPSNPTGAVYGRILLAGIAELAMEYDLWIIFDECYSGFVHAPRQHAHMCSLNAMARSRTLIINSFSKQLALTGWRIGYLAAPPKVIAAVKALQSHTTSNPNVIAQHAVLKHLREADGHYERALEKRVSRARQSGLKILSRLHHVRVSEAEGGFYFYLDLKDLLSSGSFGGETGDADDIAGLLIEKAGVAGISGTAFGDPFGLRLSYGLAQEQLEVGLEKLVRTLNALEPVTWPLQAIR